MSTQNDTVVVEGAGYAIRLDSFDGPLDLLLHLIRREELDIFDIPIARLTRAYLDTLGTLHRHQMEPASEFLVMAATLLQIKSRLLLPRPKLDDIDVGEPVDPRAELMRQLLVYQQFREAADQLDTRVRLGRDVFARPTGQDRPPTLEEDPITAQDIYRLGRAFRRLVHQTRFEHPHDIYVERISIGERIAQLAERLAETPRLSFKACCVGIRHREELITTFLALLEMTRLKLIRTIQDEPQGTLWLEARVGAIGALGEEAASMLGG